MVDIKEDIVKLKSFVVDCKEFIKKYRQTIIKEKKNQDELKIFVKNPGEYKISALKRNVEDCDKNVEEFERIIQGKLDSIRRYNCMIEVLEKKLD